MAHDPPNCTPRQRRGRRCALVIAALLSIGVPGSTLSARQDGSDSTAWWSVVHRLLAANPPRPANASAVPANGEEDRGGTDAGFLESVLTSSSSTASMRRGAAERLVRDGSPEAMRVLDRALRATDPAIAAAALAALDRAATRAPELSEAMIALAASALEVDRAALARALSAADPAAGERVAVIALDPAATLARRLGAVRTLGELPTREAAAALVELIGEDRAESPDVVREACAALERSTGLDNGTDPAAWRRWWTESSKLAIPSSTDEELRALAGRVESAERSLADERRRAERLGERLVEVYGQLFLSLTQKERLVRAANLLDDELAAVRAFAVGQLERMLRNGERADDATRRAATVLLDDPVAALRVRGVRLLDDLGGAELTRRIVERLPRERDPDVAAAYLAVLANRPDPAAFAAVLPLIRDAALGEAACRVMNRLVDASIAPKEWQVTVLPLVREVVATRPNGAAAQLLTAAGDDADLQKVTALLDSSDAAVRRGAAEGLRRRGVRRPLLERAGDSAIYGPLIAAIAEDGRSLDAIRSFVSVPPPPDMTVEWNSAVAKVLRELPSVELLEADQLLADVSACEASTRLAGLQRFASAARAGVGRDIADSGLARYVDLMVRQGRGSDAVSFLLAQQPKSGDAYADALFRAYVVSGDYREAGKLRGEAKAWIDLLSALITDPPVARPIADEIALRFGGGLAGDDKSTFERLRRALASLSPSVSTGATGSSAGRSETDIDGLVSPTAP